MCVAAVRLMRLKWRLKLLKATAARKLRSWTHAVALFMMVFTFFSRLRPQLTMVGLSRWIFIMLKIYFSGCQTLDLMNLLYDKACIPACWKQAKLSPLYKKGPLSDPNNYPMLAVSGTKYRMYDVCQCCSLVAYWVVCGNWSNPWHPMFILWHGRVWQLVDHGACSFFGTTICCTNN